jgi:transcription termination factor NusB
MDLARIRRALSAMPEFQQRNYTAEFEKNLLAIKNIVEYFGTNKAIGELAQLDVKAFNELQRSIRDHLLDIDKNINELLKNEYFHFMYVYNIVSTVLQLIIIKLAFHIHTHII